MRITITQFGRNAMRLLAGVSSLFILFAVGSAPAEEPTQELDRPATQMIAVVPQQVRFTGKLANRTGETVEVVFRIYAAAEGGEPLWTETERVAVGEDGSYTALLGSSDPKGLPQTVFAGGVARWLGLSVEQAPEQARVLLASVPYAMKSADAEALAGHAASDFVTQEQLAALTAQGEQPTAPTTTDGIRSLTGGTVTGSGTSGIVPLWTGALTQGNSDVYQVGNNIGINQPTPAALLDVNGTEEIRGALTMPSTNTATTSAGYPSQPIQMNSSAWSTTSNSAVTNTFSLSAFTPTNNVATPASNLLLQYHPSGGSTSNILSISNTGLINFASGQIFPGTLTGAVADAPLIAAIDGTTLTLQLSLTALATDLNASFPQIFANNTFHGAQTIQGSLAVTTGITAASVSSTGPMTSKGLNSTGNINVTPLTVATSASAQSSPLFELGGSAYNSTTAAAVPQTFAWQTLITGNNTASPSANLALYFGTTSFTNTGLSISPNGSINFSPSQVFPIKGTITGITTASPLTGSGTTGSVGLGLNESTLTSDITPALETTLNGVYAQLGTGDLFSNYIQATEVHGPGFSAVYGVGTNGSAGTYGSSDTGYGVQGSSTSGQGVTGQVTAPVAESAGVLGSTGSIFSNTYSLESPYVFAGVWADTSTPGTTAPYPVALIATGDDAYAGVFINDGLDFPALSVQNTTGTAATFNALTGDGLDVTVATGDGVFVQTTTGTGVSAKTTTGGGVFGSTLGGGNGVEGVTYAATFGEAGVLGGADSASITSGNFYLFAGTWGDTGYSSPIDGSTLPGAGVIGTADDSHAGFFANNSTNWTTLYAVNDFQTATGTGLFKTFMAVTPDGTCGFGSGGDMNCTGRVKALVSVGGERKVETYSVQSPENWMEDFGSAKLQSGVAVVAIDAAFAETVTGDSSYHVFITPNGDSKSLYVISKTPTTFEVRESGGGTSSLTFDYRIVGKRRGFEAQRLVDVTERFNIERKANVLTRNSNPRHEPVPLARPPLVAGLSSHPRASVPRRMPVMTKPAVRPATAPVHQ